MVRTRQHFLRWLRGSLSPRERAGVRENGSDSIAASGPNSCALGMAWLMTGYPERSFPAPLRPSPPLREALGFELRDSGSDLIITGDTAAPRSLLRVVNREHARREPSSHPGAPSSSTGSGTARRSSRRWGGVSRDTQPSSYEKRSSDAHFQSARNSTQCPRQHPRSSRACPPHRIDNPRHRQRRTG